MGISAVVAAAAEAVSSAAAAVGTAAVATAAGTATIGQVALVAGVVGTGLSVVGTITGNDTLKNVGMGLGLAGAVTGLAASAGVFDAATEAGKAASEDLTGTSFTVADSSNVGEPLSKSWMPTTGSVTPSANAASVAADAAQTATPGLDASADLIPQAPQVGARGFDTNGMPLPSEGVQPGGTPVPGATTTSATPGAPVAPQAAPAPLAAPAEGAPSMTGPYSGQPVTASGALQESAGHDIVSQAVEASKQGGGGFANWFKNQPDYVKATLLTQAAGATGGLFSGAFASLDANNRMNLERLINQQRLSQTQYENRNAAYAPAISFAPKTTPLLQRTA